MTEKTYRTKVPIYGTRLCLIIVESASDYHKQHIGNRDSNVIAFVAWIRGNLSIVVPTNVSIGTLAHEAIHAASGILKHHDSRWGKKNQEPLCYMVGWIMDWIDRVVEGPKNNEK